MEVKKYGIVVNFTSSHNNANWSLVSVYGPCQGVERDNFVSWLYNMQIPTKENRLLVGDFNFIRSQDDRNKPGGDINDMFIFNEVIGHHGVLELQLKGRYKYLIRAFLTPLRGFKKIRCSCLNCFWENL
jgi:hypothetical protein